MVIFMQFEEFSILNLKDYIIDQLVSLFNLCFGEYPLLLPRTNALFRWRYLERPNNEKDRTFIAIDGQNIVSHVAITFSTMMFGKEPKLIGSIDEVMTHPKYRRRGLAKRLMNHAIEYAKENDADGMILFTGYDSVPYHFYSKLGFVDVGSITMYLRVLKIRDIYSRLPIKLKVAVPPLLLYQKIRKPKDDLNITAVKNSKAYETVIKIHNEMYSDYEGFIKLDMDRFYWITKSFDDSRTNVLRYIYNNQDVGYSIISIQNIQQGNVLYPCAIIKFGIINERFLQSILFHSLQSAKEQGAVFAAFILPIYDPILKIFKKSGFIDGSTIAGETTSFMLLSLRGEKIKLKSSVIYPNHESSIGRP